MGGGTHRARACANDDKTRDSFLNDVLITFLEEAYDNF